MTSRDKAGRLRGCAMFGVCLAGYSRSCFTKEDVRPFSRLRRVILQSMHLVLAFHVDGL